MVNSKLVVKKKECSQTGGKTEKEEEEMAISPTDIRILFTNYDIIAYLFKPGFLFRTFYWYKTSNIGNF